MVRREAVGAGYGLRDWLAQRVTAVIMACYTLLFLAVISTLPRLDFHMWKTLFSQQWMRLATLVFVVSVLYHAWVGMRNILMDYIKDAGLRLVLHVVVIVLLVVYAGWSVQILWGV